MSKSQKAKKPKKPKSQKTKKAKKAKKPKNQKNIHKKLRIIKGGIISDTDKKERTVLCLNEAIECKKLTQIKKICDEEFERCVELNTSEDMPDWVNPPL